jgi:hypothetical protein
VTARVDGTCGGGTLGGDGICGCDSRTGSGCGDGAGPDRWWGTAGLGRFRVVGKGLGGGFFIARLSPPAPAQA